MLKRILRSSVVQASVPPLAAAYIRSARLGLTMVRDDTPKANALIATREPLITCFWHGRLLTSVVCWRGEGFDMLISRSRDGRMIARTAQSFGYGYIEGSTARGARNRGSVQAARTVVQRLHEGRIVGITPDGPRGPRMRASAGAIRLAQIAGVPIVPVATSLSNSRLAGSWDRMLVPFPSLRAKGAFLVGDPIPISSETDPASVEAARLTLEDTLNRMTAEADALVGARPVEPGPSRRRS